MEATKWMPLFLKFIKYMKIDSKELQSSGGDGGSDFELWTSQKLLLSEIAKGLSNGVRHILLSESRQLRVSTSFF